MADLQLSSAKPKPVEQAEVGFRCTLNHEIFTECTGLKPTGIVGQVLLPGLVILGWIGMQGLVAAAMMLAVSLLVSVETVEPSHNLSGNRFFGDA